MAFPTTAVLDNFNRANGGLGSNWTTDPALAAPRILSNRAAPNSSGGASGAYWNAASYGPDTEIFATLPVIQAGSTIELFVRYDPATGNGYCGHIVGTSTRIYKLAGGVFTELARVTQTWSAGDALGFSAVGNTLSVYRKPSGGSWNQTPLVTASDSSFTGAGRLEFYIDTNGAAIDDFGGGTADTTPPTVTLTGIGASRISRQSGKDTSAFTITATEAFVEYQIRAVPSGVSPVDAGTLIETASHAATTSKAVDVTDDELIAAVGLAEGTYVIKAFTKDAAGNWSS